MWKVTTKKPLTKTYLDKRGKLVTEYLETEKNCDPKINFLDYVYF
jgi:hypothetical protein